MGLSKIRIGDFITPYKERCDIPNLTCWDVSGVNKDKQFFEPSQQVGGDTSNYKTVPPNYFACNLMHIGRDCVLPIAMNNTSKNKIVSPAYTVFKLNNEKVLLRKFLFILINSQEKDRYFWFHCDSSVRDGMEWKSFCDLEFEIPDVPTQQKYVDIYDAMCANQKAYEKGLDDLKLTCDAYIEELRRKMPCEKIGPYISKERKNSDEKETTVLGIGQGGFMQPQKVPNESLKNYKLLKYGDIAYAPPLYNVLTGALHCYSYNENAVCSPIYEVFKCDEKKLLPKYLTLWLKRDEFKRYATFYALGVRQTFDYQLMEEVQVPIPTIEIQKNIVDIYDVYNNRKRINEKLKQQIKNICPILIKGAVEEGKSKRG